MHRARLDGPSGRILAGVRLEEPSPDEVERGEPFVTGAAVPWWELRYEGTPALRAVMEDIGWSLSKTPCRKRSCSSSRSR